MQALEGKDVKDMLLNVGSGGGAAAAPAAGGAAASGGAAAAAADEPAAEEKKEEGTSYDTSDNNRIANKCHRKGGVGRGHGFRSVRLNACLEFFRVLIFCIDTSIRMRFQCSLGCIEEMHQKQWEMCRLSSHSAHAARKCKCCMSISKILDTIKYPQIR